MSEHSKAAMLDNIEQSLIELIADYLDSESLILDQAIALIKDPTPREETELHIRMAKAAFLEYKRTVVDANLFLPDSCRFYEQDNTTAMNCKHCGNGKYMHGNGKQLYTVER